MYVETNGLLVIFNVNVMKIFCQKNEYFVPFIAIMCLLRRIVIKGISQFDVYEPSFQ